ncbi:MAG: ABC transporter substrate-binding protein [Alphaproteobacteria bacterium]|nr:ABC transporter substrate-binding protein [Alphaproteobacteria bacterium]
MHHRFATRGTLGLGLAAGLAALISQAEAQTLRVSNLNDPPNKGDPTVSLSYQHTYTFEALFDALTTVSGDGKAGPSLASGWTNKDPLTWEFKLKPNIKFHSGAAFNADSIVFAVKNLQSDDQKKFGASVYGSVRHVVDATKVDDLTVVIKTDRPAPILPNEIAAFRIVDGKVWTDLGRDKFGFNPSGTGPFKVTSWDNLKAEMTRADTGPRGAPKVGGVQMYFMPEAATRVQAFLAGSVDIAMGIPSDSEKRVEAAGGKINTGTAPSVAILVFNQSKGGFTTDKRVRQAFNYAIDKNFTKTLLGGHAKPAGQPAASSVNGFQADVNAYPYDPDRAKKLLAEAGFPNGLKTTAEIVTNNADLTNVYQQVAQDLSKVGVTLELKIISLADLSARVTGTKPFEAEMHVMNYGSNPSNDMMRSINAFHSCAAPQKWTCIPEAEDAIKAANSEFDPVKRMTHLRRIAQLYNDAAPQLFLYEQYELDATSPKVANYKNENWRINWHQIELSR